MGSPKFTSKSDLPSPDALEHNTFVAFADMDASPTKAWLVGQYAEPRWEWHYDAALISTSPAAPCSRLSSIGQSTSR